MNRQLQSLSLPISLDFLERLLDSHVLFEHVRALFHYCIAVTPLFALSTRSFDQSQVRRSFMVSVSTISLYKE